MPKRNQDNKLKARFTVPPTLDQIISREMNEIKRLNELINEKTERIQAIQNMRVSDIVEFGELMEEQHQAARDRSKLAMRVVGHTVDLIQALEDQKRGLN